MARPQLPDKDGIETGLKAIVEPLPAPVMVVTCEGRITYANQAAADTIGQAASALLGQDLLDFVHPSERETAQRRLRSIAKRLGQTKIATYRLRANQAQEWREVEVFASNFLDDPRINGILVAGRDVTDERAYQRQLHEAAHQDPLTGTFNRRELHRRLDADLSHNLAFALAFVGLDRLKVVNDSLGHSTGDAVLIATANRIAQSLPKGGAVFRFSGDVFAITLQGTSVQTAHEALWRLIERVSEPLFLAGHELRLSASAGLVYRDEASTTEVLLRNAALALHGAKSGGRGRVEQYDPAMSEAATARLQLEANLRRALARSELSLALQPIVETASGRAVGAEALARWFDGTKDVPPTTFIQVAEESGLIVQLGDWIIDYAASRASLVPRKRLNVNLSGRQLTSPGLRFRIAQAISSHGLLPGELGFELTESVLIEHFDEAVAALYVIRDLGCRVGLDDFGTGYSTLSRLRCLPIDFLKIDRALIADIHSDSQARAIVGAIVTMAEALSLDVIAEGVEQRSQAAVLQDLGCAYAQGFLYGSPTPV